MGAEFTLGAFAIIFDTQKRVLLCHRRDFDLWNLPGGGVENLEAPWKAVVREVKEETGLNVKVEKLVGVYSKDYKNDIVFAFICKRGSGKISINEEADQIKFFRVDSLPRNTIPHQVERIKDALGKSKKLSMKVQNKKSSTDWLGLKNK
jgi:8-oxo-dGTP diphosphatase